MTGLKTYYQMLGTGEDVKFRFPLAARLLAMCDALGTSYGTGTYSTFLCSKTSVLLTPAHLPDGPDDPALWVLIQRSLDIPPRPTIFSWHDRRSAIKLWSLPSSRVDHWLHSSLTTTLSRAVIASVNIPTAVLEKKLLCLKSCLQAMALSTTSWPMVTHSELIVNFAPRLFGPSTKIVVS